MRYYGKIHSKLPIFRVKSVKNYTGQKKITRTCPWRPWQISGMAFLSSKSFGINPDSKIFRIIERYNSWECNIFALQMWNFSVRIRQFISSCFSPRTFSEILSLLSFPFLFEESGGLSAHSLYYNQSGSVSPWMKMI